MSIFKILKYLLKYKEISIWNEETFVKIFSFLSTLSLNQIDTPALNNLKKEANKCLSILINKCTHTMQELDELVENLITTTLDLIKSGKEEISTIEDSTIGQAFSVIKGLAIKGSPTSYKVVQQIINALKGSTGAALQSVAKYWNILLSPHDFTKKNKFNISPFYKQRLFSIAFPALIENYRGIHKEFSEEKADESMLVFISKLIIPICSESSYELYKDYMKELLPLILHALTLKDETIKNI